jgi:hypothetical protein
VEMLLIILMIYNPILAEIFHHYPIPPVYWVGLLMFAPGIYSFERLRKMIVRRTREADSIT